MKALAQLAPKHLLLAVIEAMLITSVAGAQTPSVSTVNPSENTTAFDKQRFLREVTQSKDLPNFHEVHPFLYRSGEPTLKGLEKAKSTGITTLIDLRGTGERTKEESLLAQKLGLKYINLPMCANPPTKEQVDRVLSTVKEAKANPRSGAVLVHCAHGSDRTGCMIGIWRVTQDGWSYDDAYKEMRKYWFTPKFTKLSGTVKRYADDTAK